MVSVSFYPDKPKAAKTVIMVRIFPGDVRASTGISIDPKNWMGGELYVKTKEKRVNYIRARLKEIDGIIFQGCSKKLDHGEKYSTADLVSMMHPDKVQVKGASTIAEYYLLWKQEYLDRKNRGNKSDKVLGLNYTNGQRQAVDWLEKFKPNLKPKDITPALVNKYVDYLYDKTELQDESINKHLKFLRLILEFCHLKKDFIHLIPIEENESFDLYWPEVQVLKDTVYSSREVEHAAHLFVINCQLCLRWSDLSLIGPEHIIQVQSERHGTIRVINTTQLKTRNAVYIPIPPLAEKLIAHHGRLPYPLSKKGEISYIKYNEALKQAAREAGLTRMVQQSTTRNQMKTYTQAPVYQVLSTHNARHTAASRVYEATKNDALKERLLGHKKSRDPYTKVPPLTIANDLLDAWRIIEGEGR